MSDSRLKSVIQINGGGSEPSTLYPRELFIRSDGYLYYGDVDCKTMGTPVASCKDIKIHHADNASTANSIISDSKQIELSKDRGLRLIGGKLRFGATGLWFYEDSTAADDNPKAGVKFHTDTNTDPSNPRYGFNFQSMHFWDGNFHNVDCLEMNGPIKIKTCHLINGSTYGTSLPTENLTNGQLFFLIES